MSDVIDHFSGESINRPIPNPRLAYDFDFRKRGSGSFWRYINSSNDLTAFDEQIKSTINHGGEYRIIEAITNTIIKQG